MRRWKPLLLVPVVLAVAVLVPAGSVAGGTTLAPPPSPALTLTPPPSPTATAPYVSGLLSTTGPPASAGFGQALPGIYDRYGRFVLLHGVNAIYKRPPFELYVAPGKPWNFDAGDAQHIARMGFNFVRLGILWQGIEPGTLGRNNPKICAKGTPRDPHQWNQAVANRYIQRVVQTVNLLGRYHIYTLLDMHQDVYNQAFEGEGAPNWAVCTDGIPIRRLPGRWSNNYGSASFNAAIRNFWSNSVVGDIQGEFDRSWGAVAKAFAGNPWVAGYDPINEPFTPSVQAAKNAGQAVDSRLECFYTGSAHPGTLNGKPLSCSPNVPATGVIPTIRAADPQHMIFLEPTIFQYKSVPNFLGPIPYPNLVLNFHAYCGARSPVTGNPSNVTSCFKQVASTFLERTLQEATNHSAYQPYGLPLFMSEFGATRTASLISDETASADLLTVGWSYWSWKYYHDPTGSSAEALIGPDGKDGPQAKVLRQVYPQAVAGTIINLLSDPSTGIMYLTYNADPRISAPTLIWVGNRHTFARGYCADVAGATVTSKPDAPVLEIKNPPLASKVVVAVLPHSYC